jgi:mannose-1-phosphate guanylyltransferase
MQVVILAGGRGSRLWPASNNKHPKPFLKVNSELSILQETYLRARNLDLVSGIVTIANNKFIPKINNEYSKVNYSMDKFVKNSFISEPMPKNTASAIAISAIQIEKLHGTDEIMLILPSDHVIQDKKGFESSVYEAVKFANNNRLVVFGVKPNHPETGYGYIKHSNNIVEEFVEKPDSKTAESFIQSGQYLWNSGMFCFKVGVFLKEMEKYAPEILQEARNCVACSELSNSNDYIELKLDTDSFSFVSDRSIDYVLMEKSKKLSVVPSYFDWRDIGNWDSFSQFYLPDEKGNKVNGSAKLQNVENCYIENGGKNIAVIGVKDLAIINSDEGILIADRSSVSEVKNLLFKNNAKRDTKFSWGKIRGFGQNGGPNTEQLTINFGCGFRIKDYFKYSANWLVINGSVEFSNHGSITILSDNESKYISSSMDTYITNIGSTPLVILSIQLDDYMAETGTMYLENNFTQMKNGKVAAL